MSLGDREKNAISLPDINAEDMMRISRNSHEMAKPVVVRTNS